MNTGNEQVIRGLVIDESFTGDAVPVALKRYAVRTYPFHLNGAPIHITELRLPEDVCPAALLEIAEALAPERYYAHFVRDDTLYVIFPGVICSIKQGHATAMRIAKMIGCEFRIPVEQMPFEGLFTDDHPGGA